MELLLERDVCDHGRERHLPEHRAGPRGTVSCDDLCKHVQACALTVTAAQCAQLCAGYNETCKKCVLEANCSAPKTACDTQCH